MQIAEELAQTHEVTLAVGKRPPTLPQRLLGRDIFWWLHQLDPHGCAWNTYAVVEIEGRLGAAVASLARSARPRTGA